MPIIAASILIQILCAVHCVRNGRNQMWLMVIIFLSIPGCLAYAFFEILPDLSGRREVRRVRQAAAKALDPEREIRRAQEALETADTAANRIALADVLVELKRWGEAIPHYEIADLHTPGVDRGLRMRLARAYFETGRNDPAREVLEKLPESSSPSENDRAALLLARVLEQQGETARALAIYADVGIRLPGAEAQCRQAALLISLDRRREALPILGEVERRLKRLDTYERAANAEMYDWAARNLAELRANST